MTNSSSDRYTPAFITPKINQPNIADCRWHLLVHFDTEPCGRGAAPPMYGAPIILCNKHQQEIAEGIRWVSPEQAKRNIHERADRVARTKLAQKDETIAHLRSWLDEERSPKRSSKSRPVLTEGQVYFLQSDSAVKIGWTTDLDQRMKSYSPGAKILAVMPGTRKDETRLHRKFAHLRTNRREWFSYSPQVMEEVARVVKEHGDPPRDLNEPMTTAKVVGPRLSRPTQRRARSLSK